MRRPNVRGARPLLVGLLALAFAGHAARSGEEGWIDLTPLDAWNGPIEGWSAVGSVALDAKDAKKLAVGPGSGIIYNGPTGRGKNLTSVETFEDVEMHVEFLIPKGSNSGVKFQAKYEVQIFDSFGASKLKGSDCGGVYPRSEEKPKYHHIDDGHAPLLNACKAPGEWQVMDMTFHAPRFDAAGKEIADARITVLLNGKTVQDNLKVETPTGAAWHDKEKPTGPLLVQADHGPVAFRNVRARKLPRSH